MRKMQFFFLLLNFQNASCKATGAARIHIRINMDMLIFQLRYIQCLPVITDENMNLIMQRRFWIRQNRVFQHADIMIHEFFSFICANIKRK